MVPSSSEPTPNGVISSEWTPRHPGEVQQFGAEVDDVGLQVPLDGGLRLGQDAGSGQVLPDPQPCLPRHGAQAVVLGLLLAQPFRLIGLRVD